jgi:hypothetical protein
LSSSPVLMMAGVAAGSCDMPSKEPLPVIGTDAQPATKGCALIEDVVIDGEVIGELTLSDGADDIAGAAGDLGGAVCENSGRSFHRRTDPEEVCL